VQDSAGPLAAVSAVRSMGSDADTVTAVRGIIGRLVEDAFVLFGDSCDVEVEEEPMGVEVVRWIPERGAVVSAEDRGPILPESEAAGAAGDVAGIGRPECEETWSEETAGMVWDA
jgi:hypothetical protein